MYDCLIIGGGLAGLTAAIYTARAGLSTAVIEGEQCGGQAVMADLVENYPGFVGSGYELAEKTEQQAENVGVEIIYDEMEAVKYALWIYYGQNRFSNRFYSTACLRVCERYPKGTGGGGSH